MRSLAAAACSLVVLGSAALAGPYDGAWLADIPPQGACNFAATITLEVVDTVISGTVSSPAGTFPLSGTMDAAGNGTFRIGELTGAVRFTGDRFEADYANECGARRAEGARTQALAAPPSASQKAEGARRYADLVRRLRAGDTDIDFTALRNSYPLTAHYDPYSARTKSLADQAVAAMQAGDCTTAMTRANEALEIDYTMGTPHGVRSECLKRNGNARGADQVTAIIRGLTESLRRGADGKSETSAYVIVTMWERDYIAAIAGVRADQVVNIRGKNGHVYQVVTGRTRSGEPVTLYFDAHAMAGAEPALIPLVGRN